MVAKNLRILRELKDMRQSDVAKAIGISSGSYQNKETGKTEFTLSEAKKISDLFALSLEEIFFNPIDNKLNTR